MTCTWPLLPQASSPAATAHNLISLLDGASLGELTSLEEMIAHLMKGGHIPSAVVRVLWDMFTGRSPDTSPGQRQSSVLILAMAAAADGDIVKKNLNVLIQHGLGGVAPGQSADLLLARNTCAALQKLGGVAKGKSSEATQPFRLPASHPLFEQLTALLRDSFGSPATSLWCSLAEGGVATIYGLSEQPERACGRLLQALTLRVFGPEAGDWPVKAEGEAGPIDSQQQTASFSQGGCG